MNILFSVGNLKSKLCHFLGKNSSPSFLLNWVPEPEVVIGHPLVLLRVHPLAEVLLEELAERFHPSKSGDVGVDVERILREKVN